MYYDVVYSFKNYEKEAEKIRNLIQQHKQSAGDTLLDVACGTGNHLTFLQRHYRVEGLDLDQNLLEIARRKLPNTTFHHADMTDFNLKREYDIITCLFSAIGYVKTKPRLQQTIRNMRNHLRAGGVMIIEPWLTPDVFGSGTLHGLFVDKPDLKIARINLNTVEDGMSILNFHYLVGTARGVECFTERHEQGLFTHDEYKEAFTTNNLKPIFDPEGLMGRGLYIATKAT